MNTSLAAIATARHVSLTRPESAWFAVHPALGITPIDHLYNRLDGAYPHKWRSNFADAQAIENWAESWVEEFEDEGITFADIRAGIKACRTRFSWPPSCAEFISACKPFADPVAAYHEAVAGLEARAKSEMGIWSHPAVYWAATLLSRDLMGQTYGQVKDRWVIELKAQLARTEWAAIPPPRLQIEAPGKGELSKESVTRMLQQLNASGIFKTSADGIDHRRWARRNLERVAGGDKSLSMAVINFSKEGLGLHERCGAQRIDGQRGL